ncbi:gliding motility lipoprotein GldH [Parasediminibacterium paludis]|uniref:Gliding motility lipoprotein GldH n=1 Tax=Parasediminibacterium paludis TaxID=908966 RepID=A0ABV8PSS8_9BACT
MKIIVLKYCSLFIIICVLFIACNTLDVFEKSSAFDKHEWKSTQKPSFDFTIADTNALYNIYVIVRHDDAYHYNNLWLNITTQAPASMPETQQIELTLANNAKGWLGTGMDDVYDHRIRITNAPIKLKKGNYHFTIQHTMREDPLPYVLSAGIRVEKVQP